MRVELRLFSTLGKLAGRDRLTLELPQGATIARALEALEALPKWGASGVSQEYAWRHGSTDFTLALNGRHVASEGWESTLLSDGDQVWLQPPIAGG